MTNDVQCQTKLSWMILSFHLRASRLLYIYTHYILNVLHFLRSSISLSLSFCLLHALRPVPHQSTNGPSKVQQHWGALEDYLEHRLGKTQIKNTNKTQQYSFTYHYLPLPTITYHLILPPISFLSDLSVFICFHIVFTFQLPAYGTFQPWSKGLEVHVSFGVGWHQRCHLGRFHK